MDTQITTTVHNVIRLKRSRLGNPKFQFLTANGHFFTKTDTGQAIRVSSEFRIDELDSVKATLILHNNQVIDWIKH